MRIAEHVDVNVTLTAREEHWVSVFASMVQLGCLCLYET